MPRPETGILNLDEIRGISMAYQFENSGTFYYSKYDAQKLSEICNEPYIVYKFNLAKDLSKEFFNRQKYTGMEFKLFVAMLVLFGYEKKRERSFRGFRKFVKERIEPEKFFSISRRKEFRFLTSIENQAERDLKMLIYAMKNPLYLRLLYIKMNYKKRRIPLEPLFEYCLDDFLNLSEDKRNSYQKKLIDRLERIDKSFDF